MNANERDKSGSPAYVLYIIRYSWFVLFADRLFKMFVLYAMSYFSIRPSGQDESNSRFRWFFALPGRDIPNYERWASLYNTIRRGFFFSSVRRRARHSVRDNESRNVFERAKIKKIRSRSVPPTPARSSLWIRYEFETLNNWYWLSHSTRYFFWFVNV